MSLDVGLYMPDGLSRLSHFDPKGRCPDCGGKPKVKREVLSHWMVGEFMEIGIKRCPDCDKLWAEKITDP